METLDREREPIRRKIIEDFTYPFDLAELRLYLLLRLLQFAPVNLIFPLPLGVLLLLQHGTEVHTTGVCVEVEADEWRMEEGRKEEGAKDKRREREEGTEEICEERCG